MRIFWQQQCRSIRDLRNAQPVTEFGRNNFHTRNHVLLHVHSSVVGCKTSRRKSLRDDQHFLHSRRSVNGNPTNPVPT